MKRIKVVLLALILISAGSAFQQAVAQEKTKAEQAKEAKLQQAIDEQKKAMTEQKKAQEEASQELYNQKNELEKNLKDIQVQVESAGQAGNEVRILNRRGNRAFLPNEPFIWNPSNGDAFFGHSFGGDEERTTWDFSKSVKDNTFSRDYTFDVEKTVKSVVMSVSGDCKSGEIRIKILNPGGKTYSDIIIDESGNLNWRKSFSISETENQDKTGEWKFQIASNKASGFFKISLQTY
jgi:hypothetical protein